MNNRAIGIIDAGFGGLAAAKSLRELLPSENIIYFSDIARYPYEKYTAEEVGKYIAESGELLAERGVKLILNASGCIFDGAGDGTLCGVPFIGTELPAAQAACSSTRNGKIGIIGSAAAVRNGIIGRAVRTIRPGTIVCGNVSMLIAPAVLGDYVHRNPKVMRAVVEDCLTPFGESGADTIILGSSYCEFVKELILEAADDSVTIVSPAAEAAKAAELYLFEHDLLTDCEGEGESEYIVNSGEDFFVENASALYGEKLKGTITCIQN